MRDETREDIEYARAYANSIRPQSLDSTTARSYARKYVEVAEALDASRERERHLREAVQDLHDDELEQRRILPADEAIEERRCCMAAAGAYRRVLRLLDAGAPATSSEASESGEG